MHKVILHTEVWSNATFPQSDNYFVVCCGPTHPRYLPITLTTCATRDGSFKFGLPSNRLQAHVCTICSIGCGSLSPPPLLSSQCVNTVNSERPEEFEYISDRTHPPEVPLLSDSESMACCSCTDDDGTNGDGGNKNDGCRNRSKCGCWQLTIEEAQPLWSKHTVGYVYGRLRGHQYSA